MNFKDITKIEILLPPKSLLILKIPLNIHLLMEYLVVKLITSMAK